MTDIEKALCLKLNVDSLMLLPEHYCHKLKLFQLSEAEKLLLLQGSGINYRIELKQIDDKDSEVLWGLLYNILREKLLTLCKKLMSLLNKGFIYISWFPAASPVLFTKKPERGLWFCINYKALNAIMKKNCYPLLLIHKTLNQINKAKWFTKLNVFIIFHKLWITEEQKWLIVFKTYYELFE